MNIFKIPCLKIMASKLMKIILAMVVGFVSIVLMLIGSARKKRNVPSSILYSVSNDQVFHGKSIDEFLAAVTEERFHSFFDTRFLLVEVRSLRSFFSRNNHLTIDASLYLATKCLRLRHYPSLIREVLRGVKNFEFEKVVNMREAKTILFDLPVYQVLINSTKDKIDLVTTNSALNQLPVFFKLPLKGSRVMLWYSTNSKPLDCKDNRMQLLWSPSYIKERIDVHLIWTEFDKKFLNSLGIENVHVVGSILMQPKHLASKDTDRFIVTIFDVTPMASKHDWKYGGATRFYSEVNALKDLDELLDVSSYLTRIFGMSIVFRIKPKRAYAPSHSKSYVGKIKRAKKNFSIEVLDPSSNLYYTVSQSDMVIATPWTSPAVLARELSVNSVYFSSRGDEWNLPSEYEKIRVLKSSRELTKYLIENIESKLQKRA